MSAITEYEIEDIGIDHLQYFPGRSTFGSRWKNVYVGAGVTPINAYDQAVSEAHEDDWESDIIDLEQRALYHHATQDVYHHPHRITQAYRFTSAFHFSDIHAEDCPVRDDSDAECDGCELMYYIAIYVR